MRALAPLAALLVAVPALAQTPPQAEPQPNQPQLQEVARFEHQVTGVAVSKDGRIFVNFPRWTEDSPVSVAEVTKDGAIRPYPDDKWNAWRNARKDELSAREHFVSVQSVVADGRGNLWVLDPAAPAMGFVVPGGPKLVKIELSGNRVAEIIRFDEEVAPQGSYVNDVRFSPDGRHAYITDSGARGALIVVELSSGRSRRVLDGHPTTQAEKTVQVKADGQVLRRPDGRGVEFAADGIALSADGSHLYWQAIKGKTLYRVPTEALTNARLQAKDLENQVEVIGENGVADGLLITAAGRMVITAPEEDALKVRDGNRVSTLVQDGRLRWPDSLAEGPDGSLYVTTSRIQDSAFFKPDAPAALPTQLWRLPMGQEATGSVTRPPAR